MEPEIRFATSADGTRIAYAILGDGPPMVVVRGWLAVRGTQETTLEEAAARDHLVASIHRRGLGGSQREVEDLSLEAHVADISAVVDHLRLERFELFGAADGAAVCVSYAVQHRSRVTQLILSSLYSCGEDFGTPQASRALADLIRQNWGVARRALADLIHPTSSPETRRFYSEVLREAVSPEVAGRYMDFSTTLDIRSLLPRVRVPTTVLQARSDKTVPFRAGRAAAALIPNARFLALERGLQDRTGSGDVVTVLFTDMESSTALRRKLGDARAQELVRTHNQIVRDALKTSGGNEIKHTGDGIMASFTTATSALQCAIAIQQGVASHVEEQPNMPLGVYIGLNAGEPIAEEQDLFGTSVDLARRICDHAEPGQILASNVVRELSEGKGFFFGDIGDVVPKGFEQPVRLYEVRWREDA